MSEQEELECQNHANCGEYCYTQREREMVLCEDCLDSFEQRQRDYKELEVLRTRCADLQSRLDAAEKRARKAEADSHRILKTYKGLERVAGVVSDHSDEVCGENNELRQRIAALEAENERLRANPAPELWQKAVAWVIADSVAAIGGFAPIYYNEDGAKRWAEGRNIIPLYAAPVAQPEVHLNSADKLPPVGCPLLIELPSGLTRAERTGIIADKANSMEYRTADGRMVYGRFPWTYP